ncbi:MAG: NAD(P)H-hydrate dehydratase [Rhodospirillales bacterium]|nr:NAD(P)H-hydrate dehydratase [Rhodospirillales bacterium]MBO6786695.1 NAD(P)H-hydrate dehydratase [Rhodospirillales bacterium]
MNKNALLTVAQMATADKLAIRAGTPGMTLMEHAGRAVAEHAARLAGKRPIVVLCGPGNNGGDGYVAARYLKNRGHRVRIACLGDPEQLNGDALANYRRWQGTVEPLAPMVLEENCVLVDALFGAGLARNIEGVASHIVNAAAALELTTLAVDLPSGVNGDSGAVMGCAIPAAETVTFFRKKPGHLLYPGRGYCGNVHVVDIGVPESVLSSVGPDCYENTPDLWKSKVFGIRRPTDHKYTRGHAVIAGSVEMTGAARLAARGARRAGAGLVTLAVPETALPIYLAGDPGNLVEPRNAFTDTLADPRRNAVLVGPGIGVGPETRDMVLAALKGGTRAVVLDADALTSFADDPKKLFDAIRGPCIMTPHEGEFRRLFDIKGDKVVRARKAAEISGAVIVLKGADTVVAAPDGRAAINASAPPWLGTAGAGDVLAGVALGFLAHGAPPFESAAAAVWSHGAAAHGSGPGLIAEDLPEALPAVFANLSRA